MKIDNEVLEVLSRCGTVNNQLFLPGTLPRRLYVSVNRVLEALGWKWNRKARAHLVGESVRDDAELQLQSVILTGEVRFKQKELQQFFTPLEVVETLVDLADIDPTHLVLEPSSGNGAIAAYVSMIGCKVECIEIDVDLVKRTRAAGLSVLHQDFLTVTPSPVFDRVLMNPPFTKRQEAAHVMHALQFLKPGGRLVSVMSAGIEFRQDELYKAVRDMVTARGGTIMRLPPQSFAIGGTDVATCLVSIEAVRDNSAVTPRVVQQARAAGRPQLKIVPPVQRPEEFTLVPRTY